MFSRLKMQPSVGCNTFSGPRCRSVFVGQQILHEEVVVIANDNCFYYLHLLWTNSHILYSLPITISWSTFCPKKTFVIHVLRASSSESTMRIIIVLGVALTTIPNMLLNRCRLRKGLQTRRSSNCTSENCS